MQIKKRFFLFSSVFLLSYFIYEGYIGHNKIPIRLENFNESINSVFKQSNKNLIIKNHYEKGIFTTTGYYDILNQDFTNHFIINYRIQHAISSWFGGDIIIKFNIKKIENMGNIQIVGNTNFEGSGEIKKNSDYNLSMNIANIYVTKLSSPALNIETDKIHISIKNINNKLFSYINFDNIIINSSNSIHNDHIDFSSKIKNITLLNEYNNTTNIHDFSLLVNNYQDLSTYFDNLAFLYHDNLNQEFKFKIINLNNKNFKNLNINTEFNISKLSPYLKNLIKEMFYYWINDKSIETYKINKIKNELKSNIEDGIILDIKSAYLNSNNGSLKINGIFNSNYKNDKSFSLNKDTFLDLKLSIDGHDGLLFNDIFNLNLTDFNNTISYNNHKNINNLNFFDFYLNFYNGLNNGR